MTRPQKIIIAKYIGFVFLLFYGSVLPFLIAGYGIDHNWEGFSSSVPRSEVQMIFGLVWLIVHAAIVVVGFMIWSFIAGFIQDFKNAR